MKKGAIHIDWVISIGIFLVYIIVLLVLIKPSYKSVYEGDALTTMIKDEFIKQNKVDAGFVVFKAENCRTESETEEGIDVLDKLTEKLSNINNDEINIKELDKPKSIYRAYFSEGEYLSADSVVLRNCENVEIGEVMNYTGLKQGLNFETKDFKFPSSRSYKITVYPGENIIIPKKNGETISMGEPPSEAKVYVLDWSVAKLSWDATKKEITRSNIIINIQVW